MGGSIFGGGGGGTNLPGAGGVDEAAGQELDDFGVGFDSLGRHWDGGGGE